jgi:cytoskeleton protein RodZ
MPDIGSTLREARMRARIDISEIETETKIRAKYLRALENEEWDLLPGPTYVKSFLRTYADALGLDGKLLIEEYKLRHERLSDVELQPIAPLGQRDRRRAPRPAVPRGWLIAVVVVGLLTALYFVGSNNGGDDGGGGAANTAAGTPTQSPSSSPSESGGAAATPSKKKKAKPKPKRARLTIVATGQVYVCLKAAGQRTPINGIVLTSGARQGPYRSSRFRVQLGTSEARLVVNGKSRSVPSASNGIGYEITPTKVHRLPRSRWPSCARA